jgi:hypothetical protein
MKGKERNITTGEKENYIRKIKHNGKHTAH